MWKLVGTITGTRQWQFTNAVDGRWFRITHQMPDDYYGKGLICQADLANGDPLLSNIRRLYSKQQQEIYYIPKPVFYTDRRIGVLTYLGLAEWRVRIEVWDGPDTDCLPLGGECECAEDVFPGQALIIDLAGRLLLAIASDLAGSSVVGLAIQAAAAGLSALFRSEGVLSLPDWTGVVGVPALAPGRPYYLSPDVPGALTLTAPTATGQAIAPIGRALSSTALDLQIQSPILL